MQTPRDKIRELRALLDEGLLSEQEFSERKNAILDRELAPHISTNATSAMSDLVAGTDLGFVAGQEVGGFSKRYRLERLLGQGGMGQVWLAIDLATQAELGHSEMVALKILPPQLTQSTVHARLLIEEASMVRKLAHENIVRVYEWAQDPATSSYFIIMEYLAGQDLETYLAAHGPCSLTQIHQLLMPVAHALEYAWQKHRLVHRDLKPGNLFLTQQGDIKLLDFGISARLRSHTSAGIGSKSSTKLPGAGTFGYRAPEAGAQQGLFSPSLDVYAVAVMMLEMLTGALPGIPHHPYAQAPKRPTALNAAQWQVLQSGFALDPSQRPANVLALLKAMAAARAGGAHASDMPAVPQERPVLSQSEITARLRTEQRRQRKELEEQRRRQASASLRALIAKQKKILELEQQESRKRGGDTGRSKSRIRQIHSDHDAQEQGQPAPSDGHDSFAAPIATSLMEAITTPGKTLDMGWQSAAADFNFRHPEPADSTLPMAQANSGMSWEDAKRYLIWLSQKTGRQVRLPSEAEWDSVCRGVSDKLKR
jgi:serine/threonine protein kinase